MTDQHTINYIEGNGISVAANENPDLDLWEVEIANETYGLYVAKGDLAVATGEAAADRLPAGTDGQVLTADSGQAVGVKWAAAASGDPSTDTKVWMPLIDTDGSVVLDDDEGLIPTLIAIA
ncbi:MAG: hypothetical protein E6J90_52355 [Deltaproteobacteria bacterium]|nr:MAG: hypothetical protein E6J90_52355 [Deltaproteobacteria bacterium]